MTTAMSPGAVPCLSSSQHLRAAQLQLGALAARHVHPDGVAWVGLAADGLEQAALQGVKRGARVVRVVVGDRLQVGDLGAHRHELLAQARRGLERLPAGLVRERDGHVGIRAVGQHAQRLALERREVVEPVEEDRRPAPALRLASEGLQSPPREQVGVDQPGGVEPVAIAAVHLPHLVRIAPPRTVARPVAHRPDEARCLHHRVLQLGDEPLGGAGEPRAISRRGHHLEVGVLDRLLHDQPSLQVRRGARHVTRPLGDQFVEPLEAQHSRPEHRAALGQLALAVLHILERGHDEHRLLVEPVAEGAEHGTRLGGVGRPGYESEWHGGVVATDYRLLTTPRKASASRAAGTITGAS